MGSATSPSASSRRLRCRPFVVVGNPGTRRVRLFQDALLRLDQPPACVVPYADLLAGRVALPDAVTPGAVVRIESPDEDPAATRAILRLGAEASTAEGLDAVSPAALDDLLQDRGRLLPSRQWYLGFCAALRRIEAQLAGCPAHTSMSHPADVAVMFDKPRCHRRLLERGLSVPPVLGPVRCYDELLACMQAANCYRVFVKPAHGSSASGVVAYQTNGRQHRATTTVEMVRRGSEIRLFNSKRVRTYDDVGDIAAIVDALCRQRVHVERWLPKAGLDNRAFDLRVVVIAGRARHVVARLSRGPITNLHLDNAREGPERVQARMGTAAWAAARQTCERALACFERSLYAGIDLLVGPGFRRHAILEVNAFGDLLLDTFHDGLDTYATEALAALGQVPSAKCQVQSDGAERRQPSLGWEGAPLAGDDCARSA